MFKPWKSWLEKVNAAISWLLLAMAALIVLNIAARYFWNRYTMAGYELILYLHIWVVFISLSYAMLKDAHIGINILVVRLRAGIRRWLQVAMTALLAVPTAGVILWLGGEYALTSWQILEKSQETGGLDFVYLSKTAIPVGFALVLIQAVLHIAELSLLTGNERGQSNESDH